MIPRALLGTRALLGYSKLSLTMNVEELETMLRKQAYTEEECARIVGSCNSLAYYRIL